MTPEEYFRENIRRIDEACHVDAIGPWLVKRAGYWCGYWWGRAEVWLGMDREA
jgi:hypothetical protein